MVVFEGGAPKKSDYRRFTIRTRRGSPDDYASMAEVLSPALRAVGAPGRHLAARPGLRRELRRAAQPRRDRRRQGTAGGRARRRWRAFVSAGVAVISLAKRIEEVFIPGRCRAAGARPLHARAAAAAARPRRGAPVRDHPPPQPAGQGDDELAARRAARDRSGPQARAAGALRLSRGGRGGLARGAGGGARGCRRRWAASCYGALHRAG